LQAKPSLRTPHDEIKALLDVGVRATINTDDPAYFPGYMNENLHAVQEAARLARRGTPSTHAQRIHSQLARKRRPEPLPRPRRRIRRDVESSLTTGMR
jgi:hypothetical protein